MSEQHPSVPAKVGLGRWRRLLRADALEDLFFVIAMAFAFGYAWRVLTAPGTLLTRVAAVIVFWAVLAYLALPRLNLILTSIYVPDYYMGRTRTADGVLGDAVNLALQGDAASLHTAMTRAGWHRADPVTLRSSWGIIVSAVLKRSYPTAPVSPLLLFGHPEAFAYQQEVDGNASQRHHVRFWPTPQGWLLPGGHRVDWLAAASYDRAVGLSLFTLQVTHKVDADLDLERDHVVSTLRAAAPQAHVDMLSDFTTGYHSRNGGGDVIRTDGALPIIDLGDVTPDPADQPRPAVRDAGSRPVAIVLAGALSLLAALLTGLRLMTTGNPIAPVLLVTAALVALSWFVYQGALWARLLMLTLGAVSLGLQVRLDDPSLGSLLSAGLDLAVMYALTASSARRWTAPTHRGATRAS